MGDTENSVASSKKRVAGRQISKDNPEVDADTTESEMGSFQRASEEVLASRRIVKVRRQQLSSNASSNPFAGIRLVSSTDSTAKEKAHVGPSTDETNGAQKRNDGENREIKSGVSFDERNGAREINDNSEYNDMRETTSIDKVSNNALEEVSQPLETAADAEDEKKLSDGKLTDEHSESIDEARGKAEEIPKDLSEETQKETGNMSGEKVEEGNKGEMDESDIKEAHGAASPFCSFGKLSNSQNAFTSLSGTGFGTSSFSFGSLKEGSAFGSSIFGSSNNGTSSLSLFGLSGTDAAKNESSGGPLLQEVPVETGEENEMSVFTADATLYEYLDGSWKERGRGEIKVNTSISGEKARLVMRARGNYRLILNANLYPDMTLANMDKRGITFTCINSAGERRIGLVTCALKFKDSSSAEEFRGLVTEHKGKKLTVLMTPENSPKASDE